MLLAAVNRIAVYNYRLHLSFRGRELRRRASSHSLVFELIFSIPLLIPFFSVTPLGVPLRPPCHPVSAFLEPLLGPPLHTSLSRNAMANPAGICEYKQSSNSYEMFDQPRLSRMNER